MRKRSSNGTVLAAFFLGLLIFVLGKYGSDSEAMRIPVSGFYPDDIYAIPLVEAQATPDQEVQRPGPAWLTPGAIAPPETEPASPAPPPTAPAPYRPKTVTPAVSAPAPEPEPTEAPPPDENQNRLDDRWEEAYNITEPGQDVDGDGLYDSLEYVHATNPREKDTDRDGFTDAEEILHFRTDPLDLSDPGTFEAMGIRITSFDEGQVIADSRPLIKGVAPPLATIELVLRTQGGEEKLLGQTGVSENGIFLFQPEALEDGEYEFIARLGATSDMVFSVKSAHAQGEKDTANASVPVKVRIDTVLEVAPPRPTKLADREITEEILFENLRIEIRDRKPVLLGRTNFRTKVIATWRSIVLTSALIADSPAGEFEIEASDTFNIGEHEVLVQAIRPEDKVMSGAVRIPFTIVEEAVSEPLETAQPETPEANGGTNFFQELIASSWTLPVSILIAAAVLGSLVLRKKKKNITSNFE